MKDSIMIWAVGNFALTVVLLQKFAEMAARHIPQWESLIMRMTTKRMHIDWCSSGA
jgi:hypothetical protein